VSDETCGRCGHGVSFHGRRGYGSCRHREPTDETHAKIAQWHNEGMRPEVILRLAECLFALGGATECDCRRFRVSRPVAQP
jgi:hypothetical protein